MREVEAEAALRTIEANEGGIRRALGGMGRGVGIRKLLGSASTLTSGGSRRRNGRRSSVVAIDSGRCGIVTTTP